MIVRLRANDYRSGQRIDVRTNAGLIESITPAGTDPIDLEAGWIAPALFDIQINGCKGKAFGSDTLMADDVYRIIRVCQKHGISRLMPTIITGDYADICHGLAAIARACGMDEVDRAVAGIHLEGPYISPEDGPRGAHPRASVRLPDRGEFRDFADEAQGRIRMVTLAPEIEGAIPFIEWLIGQGVVVAIGHTAAKPQQIRDAIRAGARISTHLGNGSHAVLPRHDNYIWEQAAADGLWASLITDGHHLPPAVVRCLIRAKTPERVILTCDASSLAGCPPGRYREWGTDLEVLPGGKVIVSGTPYLAGSGVFTDVCVRQVVRQGDVTLKQAIEMAAVHPRQLMDLPAQPLEVGQPVEVILFESDEVTPFRLTATVIGDEVIRANLDSTASV